MTSFEHLKGFFFISTGFLMLFGFYTSIRVRMFIVKRYEQETDLMNTIYFREHATFVHSLPSFFSSPLYVAHLISFLWCWNYAKKKKPFRDINDPGFVTQHFSRKEIRLVKRYAIIMIIFLLYIFVYLVLKFFYPEVLNL